MRVLHAVQTFLNISENWIYPQVAEVPETESFVVCDSTSNLEVFPLPEGHIICRQRIFGTGRGLARFWRAFLRRSGLHERRILGEVRRCKPALLHAHFGPTASQSLLLRKGLGIPLVASFYGYDAWQLPHEDNSWKPRYRELFDAGSLFLVEGPAMRNRLVELGCPPEKVRVHRLGVNLENLQFQERTFSGPLSLVMVGRFVEKKGMSDGLRACALAAQQGTDLRVTIVGDAPDSDSAGQRIKAELLELAKHPALLGKVTFAGFRPLMETKKIVSEHQILLCPSRHAGNGDAEGGSPVVLTEAMAQGLLCIGTRHCDIPEVILDGKTGFLCDEGDGNALAGILSGICRNTAQISRMIPAGRNHIEEHFSLSRQLSGLQSIYLSLL